ncbi:MAG: hypothetical protein P8188_18185 [Gemmatimonadota bacterium]
MSQPDWTAVHERRDIRGWNADGAGLIASSVGMASGGRSVPARAEGR